MADTTGQEDDEETGEQPAKRNWRKELEDRAKLAEEKAAQFERELAFTKAGLDGLSDKQVKALVATHEGEMTAEALKASATDLGFVTETAAQPPAETQTQPLTLQGEQAPELAELARLANSPANHPESSQDGRPMVDLEQYTSNDELKAYLMENVEWVQPSE